MQQEKLIVANKRFAATEVTVAFEFPPEAMEVMKDWCKYVVDEFRQQRGYLHRQYFVFTPSQETKDSFKDCTNPSLLISSINMIDEQLQSEFWVYGIGNNNRPVLVTKVWLYHRLAIRDIMVIGVEYECDYLQTPVSQIIAEFETESQKRLVDIACAYLPDYMNKVIEYSNGTENVRGVAIPMSEAISENDPLILCLQQPNEEKFIERFLPGIQQCGLKELIIENITVTLDRYDYDFLILTVHFMLIFVR